MSEIKLSMPIPKDSCCPYPFFTALGTSLGLLYPDNIILGLPQLGGDLNTCTPVPFMVYSGGSNSYKSGNNGIVYAVPNPFGDPDMPTIFVGGATNSFLSKNPFDQYLQAFRYLSWPEQLKMYQVAGARGRNILATSGVSPAFSNLTPAVLVDI